MTTAMLTAVVLTTTIPLALSAHVVVPNVRPLNRDWIFNCKRCKAHRRLDRGTLCQVTNIGGAFPDLPCCGQPMAAKPLKGVVTEHKCSAKCRTSKGHVCECSCGGKNHGRDA